MNLIRLASLMGERDALQFNILYQAPRSRGSQSQCVPCRPYLGTDVAGESKFEADEATYCIRLREAVAHSPSVFRVAPI